MTKLRLLAAAAVMLAASPAAADGLLADQMACFAVGGLEDHVRGVSCLPIAGGTLQGDLDMNGNLIHDTAGMLKLGKSGSSSHSFGANDAYVGGRLEVDSTLYADGSVYFGSNAFMYDDAQLRLGNGIDAWVSWSSSSNKLELWVTDGDGGGTDETVYTVTEGTNDLDVTSELSVGGVSGDGSGKAVCIKSDGDLGTCTDAVGAGGTCTCN